MKHDAQNRPGGTPAHAAWPIFWVRSNPEACWHVWQGDTALRATWLYDNENVYLQYPGDDPPAGARCDQCVAEAVSRRLADG
jgi:hypothetical protein